MGLLQLWRITHHNVATLLQVGGGWLEKEEWLLRHHISEFSSMGPAWLQKLIKFVPIYTAIQDYL
jgi:hypothetical protein